MELPSSRRRKMESSTNNELKLATVRSLNDFPEHLLLHVLSFLPTIDAIKASFISRRWRNLWLSISSLNFSYDHFPPSSSSAATRRRFADSVNQALLLRTPQSPPLLAFRLLFDFGEIKYTSLVQSWIHYAINHQALHLDIDFFPNRSSRDDYLDGLDEEPCFDFPFYALRNARVRVLKLSRFYLLWPECMSSLNFVSIRSVFFDQTYLYDSMVSDLMNGCPNLESLSFEYCWGMVDAKYFGSKIKTLSLKYFNGGDRLSTSVEIDCPNLQLLEIVGYEVDKYSLKNSSSALVEASVDFAYELEYYGHWCKVVRLLGHVEKLTVQNWWFKILEQNDFFSASFKLYNLRCLELKTEYSKSEILGIAVLLELSPNLETLILDDLDKDEDEDESISNELLNKPINLSLPRLRQAKMKCFTGTEDEYLFLDMLKKQGVVCQKIVVVHVEDGEVLYPPVVWVRNPNAKVPGSSSHWEQVTSN